MRFDLSRADGKNHQYTIHSLYKHWQRSSICDSIRCRHRFISCACVCSALWSFALHLDVHNDDNDVWPWFSLRHVVDKTMSIRCLCSAYRACTNNTQSPSGAVSITVMIRSVAGVSAPVPAPVPAGYWLLSARATARADKLFKLAWKLS